MGLRVTVAFCALVGGCGDQLVAARLADLQKQLAETQKRAAAAEQKAEALEDKVFLLTDRVETQKVESTRRAPPRLPVVTLKPQEPTDEPSDEIVFEGAAKSADPAHARPSLTLEGRKPAPAPASAKSENLGVAPAPPIHDDPARAYKAAYDALRAGRHAEAARAFRDFIRRFPEHDYADNAQYWLGECFYDRKQFVEAAPEFREVVTRYPLGNKAPDALLKLAYCLLALGDLQKGRDVLRQVPETYPRTEAARLAELRLAELGPTGGTQ
jgi:tol-pal system protein YbgF